MKTVSNKGHCEPKTTYAKVRPCSDLLQTLADILEASRSLIDDISDSLAHALCFALCAEQSKLVREARDVRCEREELIGELLGVLAELGVVGVLGIVFAPPGGGLRLEGGGVLE
jgi:hypothetical protein